MCSIPYAQRIAGRYVYRRRVHFRNIISKPLTLALRTADPAAARQRAAMLSAQFVTVNIRVKTMMQQGAPLTGEQIEEIFRRALEDELSGLLNDAYSNESWSDSVPDVGADIAEACGAADEPSGFKS